MAQRKIVYYVGFPIVIFLLCGFAYYLGWSRGKQVAVTDTPETVSAPADVHEVEQDLTYFKTLKEDQDPPVEEVKTKEVSAQPPSPAAPPKKTTARFSGKQYVIQVSAFRDVGKAHELIDDLKNRGYPAFTSAKGEEKDEWYRVFVGPYETEEQAKTGLNRLGRDGINSGFVTSIDGAGKG